MGRRRRAAAARLNIAGLFGLVGVAGALAAPQAGRLADRPRLARRQRRRHRDRRRVVLSRPSKPVVKFKTAAARPVPPPGVGALLLAAVPRELFVL